MRLVFHYVTEARALGQEELSSIIFFIFYLTHLFYVVFIRSHRECCNIRVLSVVELDLQLNFPCY